MKKVIDMDNNPIELLVNALPNHRVEIGKDVNGKFILCYAGADISDSVVRKTVCGRGLTVWEAAKDYINQITGQKLIFGEGPNREEVQIAILQIERFIGGF